MYGKKHSEEWCQQHSQFLKEKWKNDENYKNFWKEKMSGENNCMYDVHLIGELNPMYGKHHSEDTKQKISAKNKGRISKARKKVKCVETGECFDSMTLLAKHLGVTPSALTPCIDKPNRTCKNLHFIFV